MNNTISNQAPLFLKLAAVMGEIGSIPKGGTNSHFNYKFVTADSVADKVRTLLSEHKVAFFAAIVGKNLVEIRKTTEKTDPKSGEISRVSTISMRWVVDFEFTFADGESGACQSSLWTAEADSADDKGINKCATAAEKYFLLKTFVVTSADEPDADADGSKQRRQQQRPPTSPNQQRSNGSEQQGSGNDASDNKIAGWISPATWVKTRADWDEFLAKALDRFSMDAETVDNALRKLMLCEDLGDWHKSRGWALAALVAAFCKYDVVAIEAYTAGLPAENAAANFELDTMAKRIVTACPQPTADDDPFTREFGGGADPVGRGALAAELRNEAVVITSVERDSTKRGHDLWIAKAPMDDSSEPLRITLFKEDLRAIKNAGYTVEWPTVSSRATTGIAIMVTTKHNPTTGWRIDSVIPATLALIDGESA